MRVGDSVCFDVATGGNPLRAIIRGAICYYSEPGMAVNVSLGHDDGCPCLDGGHTSVCTCEIIEVTLARIA